MLSNNLKVYVGIFFWADIQIRKLETKLLFHVQVCTDQFNNTLQLQVNAKYNAVLCRYTNNINKSSNGKRV